MQVFRDIHHLPQFKNSVITIGTFDGVHAGHRDIIFKLNELAGKINGESILITFHPHPRHIITPGQPVYSLTTPEEKLNILESLGIDHVVVVPFSREFSEMTATDYAENFLIKRFNPKIIVFGYDHKFGRNREGDIHLLGYSYMLTGIVVKGDQIGRSLGFPTANIHVEDEHKLIPGDGVYVVSVEISSLDKFYYGLLNIGTRPTFNKTEKRIEVYILDFDRTIYGEEITITFLKFLRPDKKFNSSAELIAAMDEDKRSGVEFIRSLSPVE